MKEDLIEWAEMVLLIAVIIVTIILAKTL